MSWSRSTAAPALAETIRSADLTGTRSVYDRPVPTLHAPALVVARATEVRYGVAAFGVDEAELPVVCLGPMEGEDVVDELLALVREAVELDPTVGGVVQGAFVPLERNWRDEGRRERPLSGRRARARHHVGKRESEKRMSDTAVRPRAADPVEVEAQPLILNDQRISSCRP